ncbi:hypothetical protein CXB51_000452 [Gossypium anomalum]|uniref:Leucine-rich repeat-containing N-terminal plant-type domain-containing protein n=1 Tax=Gossypium anomalum TaxID=47600 RepID=A0A8J6DEF8_9ROSI|nr:hypothetical protein CXB51_000452 [Gossypium anomalum]
MKRVNARVSIPLKTASFRFVLKTIKKEWQSAILPALRPNTHLIGFQRRSLVAFQVPLCPFGRLASYDGTTCASIICRGSDQIPKDPFGLRRRGNRRLSRHRPPENVTEKLLSVTFSKKPDKPPKSNGEYFPQLSSSYHLPFLYAYFLYEINHHITDQSALLALKDHVIHDPENVLTTNWSASSPHRRVTALDLTGLGIVGTLPPHLGNLSFLSLLYVTNNSFYGGLPVQLSNLRRLKYLSFGNNSFNGEIPSRLGSLTELRRLFLYQNKFKGVIPFSLAYLSKLEVLYLFENQISGSIPSTIFNISSLQVIDLSYNMLTGSIPSVPRDLLLLEVIDFTSNNLTGHIPKDMFDHLPNLKGLYWSFNLLSGRIPASLFKCKELQVLSLSFNQMEGNLPIEIGNLNLLLYIYIGQNHFEGIIPREIGNLKNLKLLHLGFNNIVGSIPSQVFNISTLRKISFDGNQLSGHLPSNMGLFLPNLEELYLGANYLVGSIPIVPGQFWPNPIYKILKTYPNPFTTLTH